METRRTAPLVEAHRGDSANAPENTLAAFRRALDLGVFSIELDVHPAKDGALVVIHDGTVDRTTGGSGAVADMTAADLRALDAGSRFSPAFAGERIPLLEEVVALCAPTDVLLNIEIKRSPARPDFPADVVRLLRRFGVERRYVVSSFDVDALLRAGREGPEVSFALIGEGPAILDEAVRRGFPWIHGHHPTVDAPLVARAREAGIRVNVWTVDDPAAVAEWRRIGVDKICTNRPADILPAAAADRSAV